MSLIKTDPVVTEVVPRRFSANTMTNLLSSGWKRVNQKTYYWIIHKFYKYNSKVNEQTMWSTYKCSNTELIIIKKKKMIQLEKKLGWINPKRSMLSVLNSHRTLFIRYISWFWWNARTVFTLMLRILCLSW